MKVTKVTKVTKFLPFFPLCLRPVRHLQLSAALLRATTLELAILAGHLLLYPSGLVPERRDPGAKPRSVELPPQAAPLPTGGG
ncbi:lipase, partial [Streptomyces lunaelactis]|nr:lipase [Streptomyces lunaelactis]